MYRTKSSQTEHRSAMRTAGLASFDLLLPASERVGPEIGIDAADRRAVFETPIFRKSTDGKHTEMQSKASSAAQAFDGHRSHLSQEADHSASRGTQDLPAFAVGV